MDQIRKQVERARRRLRMELFLGRLVNCLFVALALAVIAIAVPKFVAIEGLPARWDAWALGCSAGLGVAVAIVWTWVSGRSALDAAIEIDRRFDLKERVASTLSLPDDIVTTPAGQALVRDAERAVRRCEIDDRFRIRLGRSAWLPVAPAAIGLALAMFVSNHAAESQATTTIVAALSPKALENSTTALRKRLVEIKKKTPKKGLKDAEALMLEMDKQLAKLAQKKEVDRKQALVKFNNLAKQLADRRDKLGVSAEVRRQLAGMKDLGDGPADKLGAALKGGNWEQARAELQKLQQQAMAGTLSDSAKKQLAEQLKKLEQQLSEASARREQAISELKKQVEEQKKKGDLAEASKLQEKLDQLMKQKARSKALEKLAQQVAQTSEQMQKGDQKAAAESMSQMMQQLDEMQQQMDSESAESEMLDMAMDELQMTQDSLTCEKCQGEGCMECQGNGDMPGDSMSGGRNGNGIGSGRSFGARPQDDIDAGFRDTRIKQNPGRGPAVITGEADGPTIRGDVREAVQEEVAAAESDEADAMVIEQMPRSQRENAEEYFIRFGGGN
jgi:hypothetical protein